jgi:hypothetical protein
MRAINLLAPFYDAFIRTYPYVGVQKADPAKSDREHRHVYYGNRKRLVFQVRCRVTPISMSVGTPEKLLLADSGQYIEKFIDREFSIASIRIKELLRLSTLIDVLQFIAGFYPVFGSPQNLYDEIEACVIPEGPVRPLWACGVPLLRDSCAHVVLSRLCTP